jgi:hypothetical protein
MLLELGPGQHDFSRLAAAAGARIVAIDLAGIEWGSDGGPDG